MRAKGFGKGGKGTGVRHDGQAGVHGVTGALKLVMVFGTHAGELASLLQRLGGSEDRDLVEAGTLAAVRRASELTGATVLLKGATTLVAAPSGDVFSQADGTPWLATAGSGDVLAGIIGALLAQAGSDVGRFREAGVEPDVRWAAIAALGAALHGKAGRSASDVNAGGPVTAGGIADSLPQIWGKVSTLSNDGFGNVTVTPSSYGRH